MVSRDGDASAVRRSSSRSCLRSSDLLIRPPACLVSRIEKCRRNVHRLSSTTAVVLNYAESTTTLCRSVPESTTTACGRSELRGVDDHSLSVWTRVDDGYVRLFPPALLMNKALCCSDQRRCGARTVLTGVAEEHVLFSPTSSMNVCGSDRRCCSTSLTILYGEDRRWWTAGSTWSSNGPVMVPLIVDDYDRKQKASTLTSTLLTHCRWVTMVGGDGDWWESPPTLTIAKILSPK